MRIATEIVNKIKDVLNEHRDFEHITFYQNNGEISMLVKKNGKKYHYVLKYYDNLEKAIKITRKLKIYYGF